MSNKPLYVVGGTLLGLLLCFYTQYKVDTALKYLSYSAIFDRYTLTKKTYLPLFSSYYLGPNRYYHNRVDEEDIDQIFEVDVFHLPFFSYISAQSHKDAKTQTKVSGFSFSPLVIASIIKISSGTYQHQSKNLTLTDAQWHLSHQNRTTTLTMTTKKAEGALVKAFNGQNISLSWLSDKKRQEQCYNRNGLHRIDLKAEKLTLNEHDFNNTSFTFDTTGNKCNSGIHTQALAYNPQGEKALEWDMNVNIDSAQALLSVLSYGRASLSLSGLWKMGEIHFTRKAISRMDYLMSEHQASAERDDAIRIYNTLFELLKEDPSIDVKHLFIADGLSQTSIEGTIKTGLPLLKALFKATAFYNNDRNIGETLLNTIKLDLNISTTDLQSSFIKAFDIIGSATNPENPTFIKQDGVYKARIETTLKK